MILALICIVDLGVIMRKQVSLGSFVAGSVNMYVELSFFMRPSLKFLGEHNLNAPLIACFMQARACCCSLSPVLAIP